MTAKITASADGTKVNIGNALGDALQIDSTTATIKAVAPYSIVASSADVPKVILHRLTTQSVLTGAYTPVVFNEVIVNDDNIFDTTTGKFQPIVAGYYQINAAITFAGGTTGERLITLYKNGARFLDGQNTSFTNSESIVLSGLVYFNGTSDYVQLIGHQVGATTLNILAGNNETYFQAYLVAPG